MLLRLACDPAALPRKRFPKPLLYPFELQGPIALNGVSMSTAHLRFFRSFVIASLAVLFMGTLMAVGGDLERGFVTPPDDAKPRVYWFWIFNRVDKEGITRDLEEFKAKGISGVTLICNGGYGGETPLLGVKYQSPEWWELFRHAVKEAKRVNIEIGFNLSAGGWVMCGPWVTQDGAMKKVVQANVTVQGPQTFSDQLPQPETVDDYYRDYCVQAIPLKGGSVIKPGEIIELTDKLKPGGRLQWDVPPGKWLILRTGYTVTTESQFKFPYPARDMFEGGTGYQIDFLSAAAFDDHFEHLGKPILQAAKEAGGKLAYLWSDSWECGKLTWTQDFPAQFRKYRGYDLKPYLVALPGAVSWTEHAATFTATKAAQTLSFVGTDLAGGDHTVFIDGVRISSNSGEVKGEDLGFETPEIGAGKYQYNPSGGAWVFGGAPGNGSGIVANGSGFNNPKVAEAQQAAFLQAHGSFSQVISGLTPGAKYTITFSAAQRPGNAQTWNCKIDDLEIGSYRPSDGITILNSDVTARFRADFDRTIQDCVADNFYGRFAEVCHQNGMAMGNEPAGPNNIPPEDALKNIGRCDFGAGEFWVHYNAPDHYNKDMGLRLNLKQTAAGSHVYGQAQAEAEAFTQQEGNRTHWSFGPAALKPYANDAFCEGINRFMLHAATCQPPSDGKPGYVYCAGQHFTPNMTWWEQSPAFFTYISRCSYMLQQGKFAADVCYFLGEEPPTLAPPSYVVPGLGSGYDCDYCNAEVLLKRMSVKNGRIVLPDGMSYRMLVLQNCVSPVPEIARRVGGYQGLSVSSTPSKAMSVEVIKKIRQLVRDGATVIGEPPEKTTGLKGYPKADAEVQTIAAEIWGNLDGTNRTERRFGKGRVIWGKSPRDILLADGVKPDCTFPGQETEPDGFSYIHRTSEGADIYYVINRNKESVKRDFTFRVTGRQPEIFDPVSGSIRAAKSFRQADGCMTLPLEFEGYGSYFVVFRQPFVHLSDGNHDSNFPQPVHRQNLDGSWNVEFDPAWGGPTNSEFADLVSWTKCGESGIKYYSGKATYRKTFDLADVITSSKAPDQLVLDLGKVKEVAEVRLNGQKLGVLWCAPWRVDISKAVKAKGNVLEVDVINLWENRVIGDLALPKERRVTKTHDVFRFGMLTKETPLIESGLLGPVSVVEMRD